MTVVAQILTRTGFDITRHPLSLLSLGAGGWIQVANFLLTGFLAIACAVGMRRRLLHSPGGLWGPLLIATFGLGMIIAGLAPPDPLLGFPPGAPAGIPAQISGNAVFHGIGFLISFLSLIAACFLFGWRFYRTKRPSWSAYCHATGVVTLLLIAAGFAIQSLTSLAFFVVGIIAFGWLSTIAAELMFRSSE